MDAVIINRISSLQQVDGYSLEAQEKHGKEYAKGKGFNLIKVWTFQETASKPEQRKKFQEVLTFIDHYNRVNPKKKLVIVVEKPDRLYRNHQDKEWCQKKYLSGLVEFHFYKDGRIFNEESSPTDIFFDDIMTSLNKYAAKNIGREALKGMRAKAESGWFPQQASFGYKNIETEEAGRKIRIIVPNQEEAPILKLIFEMRAEGKSFEEIRHHVLHSPLLPPHRTNKFRNKSSIEFIIKNPFYSGRFEWRGEWYQGKHELIITLVLFTAANEAGKRPTSRMNQRLGVLSNWFTCECGCKVTFDPKTKTVKQSAEIKTYNYYRCSNGKKIHPSYPYLHEDKIFGQLGKAVDEITITEQLAKDIADALNETHRKAQAAVKREMDSFRDGLKKLEGSEDEVYADFRKGLLDENSYKRQIAYIRTERERFTRLLEQAQYGINDAYLVTAKKILELAKNAKTLWLTRTREEQRDFLEKILSNRVFDYPCVRYEMKKPFRILSEMASSSNWLRLLDSNQRPSGYRYSTIFMMAWTISSSCFAKASQDGGRSRGAYSFVTP